MAIDHVIHYDCTPKQIFGTAGILERLKSGERAQTIIQMFRENGDERPPSEMGFEFTRSTPEGQEETELIVVQDILDLAEQLTPYAKYCEGCPANMAKRPFGCAGFVQYPLSGKAEAWLLNQLPSINEPLVWLLLKQGVENFEYNGQQVAALRQQDNTYFEDDQAAYRFLGEFMLNANQTFEMIFMVGAINPNHAAIMLLFYNAIERSELQADQIMALAPADDDKIAANPFLHQVMQGDDRTIVELKQFLQALYVAWALNVSLIVDA